MPEQDKESSYQQQKKSKPLIEDVIPGHLNGGELKNALDFILYLRDNKVKPVWTLYNSWKAICNGDVLYYIRICDADHYRRSRPDNPPAWVITPYLNHLDKYEDAVTEEGLQHILWDNVGYYCSSCRQCAPGKDVTVIGREIKSVCRNVPLIWAFDPDEATINGIKRLLKLEKEARDDNTIFQ